MKKITFLLFSLSIQSLHSGNSINSTNNTKSSNNDSIFLLIKRIGRNLAFEIVDVMSIQSILPQEDNKIIREKKTLKKKRKK
jgi:hypothetical protein